MSPLKLQLRKIILRLGEEANKLRDSEARSRWMILRKVSLSPKTVADACRFYGVSEDWFSKWGNRLRKAPRMESLLTRSRKPYRSPNRTAKRIERKVLQVRRADPALGSDRIADDLKRIFCLVVPVSTVYAILKRAKLVSKKLAQRLTKRHTRRYRRPLPGYLQMDSKYAP